jgi:hypothetical protein
MKAVIIYDSIYGNQEKRPHRVLQINGRASVRTEQEIQRAYGLRVARKYLLTPGGIRHLLSHIRLFLLRHRYAAQNVEKGRPCVIEVTPERAALLDDKHLN